MHAGEQKGRHGRWSGAFSSTLAHVGQTIRMRYANAPKHVSQWVPVGEGVFGRARGSTALPGRGGRDCFAWPSLFGSCCLDSPLAAAQLASHLPGQGPDSEGEASEARRDNTQTRPRATDGVEVWVTCAGFGRATKSVTITPTSEARKERRRGGREPRHDG